jgi:hypothetical protein
VIYTEFVYVSGVDDIPNPLGLVLAQNWDVPDTRRANPKGFFIASEAIYRDGNMECLTAKEVVQQLHNAAYPKYAVFLRSPSGTRAKFKYLHDSLDSAIEKCREYAADMASIGHLDFTYYAIEIKHRVGIEHGKIVDEPLK